MHQIGTNLRADSDGWRLSTSSWTSADSIATASNFMCGNGYLGYRGTSPEQRAADYVALVVSDTYDCADGQWRELTTAPNPLFVAVRLGEDLVEPAGASRIETELDLRSGTVRWSIEQALGDADVRVGVERFASLDQLHLLGQRLTIRSDRAIDVDLDIGVDGHVWDLNGRHLPALTLRRAGSTISAVGDTAESEITVAVAATSSISGGELRTTSDISDDRMLVSRHSLSIPADVDVVVETIASVHSSNDGDDPEQRSFALSRSGADEGFDVLFERSTQRWAAFWAVTDVEIVGDAIAQSALRFSAYHNRICTPAHTDHLPIGARGLSCQAYQGSAFWDQEIYNLPAYLFTEPEIARSLLVYRHRTLDGARRKAARLGYDGAYYAWVSGVTGDELCPDIFFEDVLTGRPIRNHFNVWQMHISPDIVTTIDRYVAVTGDRGFLVDHGAEIVFEVARFLRSFVRYDDWKGTYHCIRLLGPDEWHENVDDNAFTNHQVRAALDVALATHRWLADEHPAELAALAGTIELKPEEVAAWRRIRDGLLLPEPNAGTNLIEQFRGFFELEDVTPDVVRARLLHPDEYWGWPNGVAVATQVSKQADVAMLLWLQRDRFAANVKRANYDYYEPRCSHASSLSHAAFGMVAIDSGRTDEAIEHFMATATVDLLNANHAVVGGTFIGGIHTAACAGTYQLAVQGFGGLDVRDDQLVVTPRLPTAWESLRYPVRWRGSDLRVVAHHDRVEVTAAATNSGPVTVVVRGTRHDIAPGQAIVAA